MSNAPDSSPLVEGNVETIGKVTIYVTAICYVAGLFVANFYLRQFGFSDFTLLRTRFILTGALALVPGIVIAYWAYASCLYAFFILSNRKLTAREREGLVGRLGPDVASLGRPILVAIVSGLVLFEYFNIVQFDANITRSELGILALHAILAGLVGSLLLYSLTQLRAEEARSQPDRKTEFRLRASVLRFGLSLLVMLFVLRYLFVFSQYFYPGMSEQFGGARPKIVRLVFQEDALEEAERIGLKMEDAQRTVPLSLLWEGETMYLVGVPDRGEGWTAQIDKQLVAGVLTYTQPGQYRYQAPNDSELQDLSTPSIVASPAISGEP